jgi:hypothetical protein
MLMTRDIASFRKEVACPKMNAGAGARAVLRIFFGHDLLSRKTGWQEFKKNLCQIKVN